MKYDIIVDSCVDYDDRDFKDDIPRIPFKITIDGEEYTDRGTTVTDELKRRNYQSDEIRTACPSPMDFLESIKKAKDTFIVTISSRLSGTYQSAMTAIDMIKEEYEEVQKIHVFDSLSASAGENLITLKIKELMEKDFSFEQIIETTTEYIGTMKTFFALESLDTLVSNGRVSIAKRFVVSAFNIFPIMGENGKGEIELKTFTRGKKNVLPKLISMIGEDRPEFSDRTVGITHVNAPEKAELVREAIEKEYSFKDVRIFEAGGLSSVYGSNGGIILAF